MGEKRIGRLLKSEKDGGVFDPISGQFVESDADFRKRILAEKGQPIEPGIAETSHAAAAYLLPPPQFQSSSGAAMICGWRR
jgi:hypothetical protein